MNMNMFNFSFFNKKMVVFLEDGMMTFNKNSGVYAPEKENEHLGIPDIILKKISSLGDPNSITTLKVSLENGRIQITGVELK